jgi:hypothetical protein
MKWTILEPSPYLGRCNFAAVYIPKVQSIIFHGGFNEKKELSDFIELDLETLKTKVLNNSPTPLSGQAACELVGRMLILGGWDLTDYTMNCWLYEPEDNIIRTANVERMQGELGVPPERCEHSIIAADAIYLFGGWNSIKWSNSETSYSELWRLTGEWRWELCEVFGDAPSSRRGHSAVYWKGMGQIIVFAGQYGYSKLLNDTHALDLQTKTWSLVEFEGKVPSPRAWHAASIYIDKMYMFGGMVSNSKETDELWVLDCVNKCWEQIILENSPSPRCGHKAVMVDQSIIFLGGKSADNLVVLDLNEESTFEDFRRSLNRHALLQECRDMGIIPPQIPTEQSVSRYYQPIRGPYSDIIFPSDKGEDS